MAADADKPEDWREIGREGGSRGGREREGGRKGGGREEESE